MSPTVDVLMRRQAAQSMVDRGIYVDGSHLSAARDAMLAKAPNNEKLRRKVEMWYDWIVDSTDGSGLFHDNVTVNPLGFPAFTRLLQTRRTERNVFLVRPPKKLACVEVPEIELRLLIKQFEPTSSILSTPSVISSIAARCGLDRKRTRVPFYYIMWGRVRFTPEMVKERVVEADFVAVRDAIDREIPGLIDYISQIDAQHKKGTDHPRFRPTRMECLTHIWDCVLAHKLSYLAVVHDDILIEIEDEAELKPLLASLGSRDQFHPISQISQYWSGDPIRTDRWQFLRRR